LRTWRNAKARARGKLRDAAYSAGKDKAGRPQIQVPRVRHRDRRQGERPAQRGDGRPRRRWQGGLYRQRDHSANAEIPKVGDLIEVTYLYAFRGGSLFQPTFSMVRTDIDREDASIAQLKYKPEPK